MYNMTWDEVYELASSLSIPICNDNHPDSRVITAYPIPNGGVYAALVLANFMGPRIRIVEDPNDALIYIDDVYNSGSTIDRYMDQYGKKPAYFLVDKRKPQFAGKWVTFPWERTSSHPTGAEDHVRRLLEYIGEDPNREGLKDTPKRVLKAWKEMFSGYKEDPSTMLTVFEDGATDEMVILRDVEFNSFCEHHVLPFMGKAHIAYIPHRRVVGISKLVRVFDVYCKRLQIQERLCQDVTKALDQHLKPLGSACIIEASHTCMQCRGVRKQNSIMVTSSLTGLFKKDQAARNELMSLIRK